jgi:glycosyltransferase involved in cell wall biosynthesis
LKSPRVLLVTFFYPPRPGVASLRTRGLARYLPAVGWEPVVLTPRLPGPPPPDCEVVQTDYPGERTTLLKARLGLGERPLLEQVGAPFAWRERRRPLTRTAMQVLKGALTYPDDYRPWLGPALDAADRYLARAPVDVILSTSNPPTAHDVGRALARRHGLPWVADLRDLWTQDAYYPFGPVRRQLERRRELKVLRDATALVTVSEPLALQLGRLHGRRVHTVPNGFDPREAEFPDPALDSDLTFTHAGLLYDGRRDPEPLMRALAAVRQAGVPGADRVRIELYGPPAAWVDAAAERHGVRDAVRQHGTRPRAEVLDRERSSQILLLLTHDHPYDRGVYTGKVFEYLAARRPVLALGCPGGVVADLLGEARAGWTAAGHEQARVVLEQALASYVRDGQVPYQARPEAIERWSHPVMAQRMAGVLNEATGRRGSHPSPPLQAGAVERT